MRTLLLMVLLAASLPAQRIAMLDKDEELAGRVTALPPDTKVSLEEQANRVKISAGRGALLRITLPREAFLGGSASVGAAKAELGPTQRVLPSGESTSAILSGPAGTVTASSANVKTFRITDVWERRARSYVITVELGRETTEINLEYAANPDNKAAHLSIDAGKTLGKFHGFGGNYCFQVQSPVAQFTLDNLKSAWARTEMSLEDWEPRNDNDDSSVPNWEYFEAQDKPGSKLRNEFEMARKIQQKGIPYVISIWWLPEWLYANPSMQNHSDHRRRIAIDKWDEMLESVGTFLLYAKKKYGVEPDLFSFNEANIGVYLLVEPQEHVQLLKSMGRHFKKLGLKTKMLLADATGPDGTYTYALPAASDPEALSYCGAVSFHSWGGTTPEMYKAWGDVAEWTGLPLLVAEMGVDAQAHQGRVYDSYSYGLRELRMQQELILYAHPQSLIYWEYTPDYALAKVVDGKVEPTSRFWLMKQLSNLTPMQSDSLTTVSDHRNVLVTAFRGASGFTVQIANLGGAREASLTGLPAAGAPWRLVQTIETEGMKELSAPRIQGGTATLQLAPRSLLTLTTVRE